MNGRTWIAIWALALALAGGCAKPSADALFAKGNEYFDNGLLAEAVVQYGMAAQADPKRGDIRLKLAETHLTLRNRPAALKELVAAAELLPNDPAVQVKAGSLLLMAGRFDDAKERAEKALAVDAKSVDALVLMGNALAGLKDFDGALDEYQVALALGPAGEKVYANIGAVQLSQGQTKAAEASFRKAVDVAPASVPARMGLASFLWASGRPADAEAVMKDALRLDPMNLATNRALGAFYLATDRTADAEAYFKAIAATAKTDSAKLALADYYLFMKRLDDAKAVLDSLATASSAADSFSAVQVRLAAIEATQDRRTKAIQIVEEVLARTPTYTPARVLHMRLLTAEGKVDDAIGVARALIRDEANSSAAVDAYLAIGAIEAGRDRTEEALTAYRDALRTHPHSPATALALAQLHLRLGHASNAVTYAQQVLSIQPKSLAAQAVLVRADLMQGNLTSAARALAVLEKDYPATYPVLNLVAARELAAKRLDAARAAYTKAAAILPNGLEALEGLVRVDILSGRIKGAVDRVEAALKRIPITADLLVIAANAHASAKNIPRTEELLKQAIDREPARLAAYSLLGRLYATENRLTDARRRFEEILARNPRSVPAGTMLGMILEAQRDLPAAEAQYKTTLAIEPTASVAANNLAWIYVASNRNLDEALQLAQAAAKGLPEEAPVNDTLGWIYYRKGQFPQAVRHLELSAKRDATDASVHYHLGMAYVAAGNVEMGRKALRQSLSMGQVFDGVDEARKTLAGLGGR